MKRLLLRSLLPCLALLTAASALLPTTALADDDVVERVVVRNRKYAVDGKFEVNPGFGLSLSNRLTEHYNFELGLAYNLFETFAIELRPGYALGSLTSVAKQAQEEVYKARPARGAGAVTRNAVPNDFQDLWQIQWQGLLLPRWTPIYGKLNLATELPIHFQAFLTAGGGAVGLKRESLVYCQNGGASPAACTQYLEEEKISAAFAVGGGFRFFLDDWAALKIELFDLSFPDSHREAVDRGRAELEQPGAAPAQGTVKNAGLTNLLFLNFGTSFSF